ncbi:MAG: SGNH/GDSL hydrolase family protein, partial [Thermomicrobiales bacterium]
LMPIYQPATPEDQAIVLTAFFHGNLPEGFAVNFSWNPWVWEIVPGPAVPPVWSDAEKVLLDSRLDSVESPGWVTRQRLGPDVAASVADSRTPLRRFHRALARVDSEPCDVLVIGDSISEGLQASSRASRYIRRLLAGLRASYQPSGVAGGEGYLPVFYQGATPTTVFAKTGTPTASTYGLGRRSFFLNAAGQKLAATGLQATGFDVFYTKSTGGTFSWSVDGGAPTNVVVNGSTSDGNVVQIRNLAAGAHSIELGWVSGTAGVDGVMVYNGDEAAGVRLWDGARAGSTAAFFLANTTWMDCIATIQPDLVLIYLGTNDRGADNTLPATYRASMETLIADVRAKCVTRPSIVLVNPVTTGGQATYPWADYQQQIRDLVVADGDLALFDAGDRFGLNAWDAGADLLNIDKTHWSDAGHQFASNALTRFLLPR